ncbi:MAG: family transposase [Proteobacteria bacterium]|nr:family transposase [Pseudomonadota bacterium]
MIFRDAGSRELGLHGNVQDEAKPARRLSASQKKCNRKRSGIGARVEPIFRVVKQQFRYQRLAKNTVQVNMLIALANLYLLRKRLIVA